MLAPEARVVNRAWLHGLATGRPFVTWKLAASLDGRSAAADGTSRWISSRASRRDTHRRRAEADVMLVGTQTVLVDDPLLTVRDDADAALAHQPLRAVMGERDLPADRRVLVPVGGPGDRAPADPRPARRPRRAVRRGPAPRVPGGRAHPGRGVLAAGLVDEVVCYTAPVLLGAGAPAVADLGVGTMADAVRRRSST